jgi:hypothetical protein
MPERCSDERLLRLSHGEPGWLERLAIRFHLTRCAVCRQRQAQLESLANRLRPAVPEILLTPARIEQARQRFYARAAAVLPEPARHRRPGLRAAAAMAASLSCMLAAGLGIWHYQRSAPPAPPTPRATTPVQTPAAPPMQLPPAIPHQVAVVRPPAVMEIPRRPPAPSADTEVALLRVLHDQGLCRQGSVELVRGPDSVLTVRGVVNSAADGESLRALLEKAAEGQPLAVELRYPDEVAPAAPAAAIPPVKTAAQPVGSDLLREYLKDQNLEPRERLRESNRIANEAVRLAGTMAMEAWALRRLEDAVRSLASAASSPASTASLREMRAAHLAALGQALAAEQDLLLPIVGEGTAGSSDLAAVTRLSDLVQDTFAAAADGKQSTAEARAALREALAAARPALSPEPR